MIVLHGAWLPDGGAGASGSVLLWGERGAGPEPNGRVGALHPFVASAGDVIAALERVTGTGPGTIPRTWREGARIVLPSTPDGPRPSPRCTAAKPTPAR